MSQTITATASGFYGGQRIRVGQSFEFDGDVLPKWAVADKAVADAKITADKRRIEQGVDTRSLATQKVSKKKVDSIAAANPSADESASIA
jgi:hypothetical protein